MSDFKTLVINCGNCKAQRKIRLISTAAGETIDWLESDDNANHPIVSARKRLDGQWGFQCTCGNNDLLTDQEKRIITNPAQPDIKEIDMVVKNLESQPAKFNLREF